MIIFPKKTHPEAPAGSATVAGRTCKTHLSGALVARIFREDFGWVILDILLNMILIYCLYLYIYIYKYMVYRYGIHIHYIV